MAIIQITEEWRVQSEAHSWALAKRQLIPDKETGKTDEKWVAKSWHVDPVAAGNYWLSERVREADTHGFKQLDAERKRLKSLLTKAGLHVQNQ